MGLAIAAAGLLSAALLGADAQAGSGRAPSDPFDACRQRLAAAPDDYDSAYCFYAAAFGGRLWAEGALVFDSLMRAHPDNFWLPLALGHLYRNRPAPDVDAAEGWYRRAAAGFQRAGHAEGEILARSNLRDMLAPRGRVADASIEVARVVAIGASSSDPLLKARVWSLEATHLFDTGGDLGLAYRQLKLAEQAIFPGGPYRLKRTVLSSLGRVAFRLGRIDEALAHFGRLEEIARLENDPQSRAAALYNVLNTEALRESLLPTPDGRARLTQLARQTLAAGVAASHNLVILKAHRVIAALLANVPGSREESRAHVERCLTLAAAGGQQQDEAACAWMVATLLHDTSPREATAAQLRALDATARAHTPVADALNAGRHMQFSWLARPRAEAIRASLRALDALEALRGLQETPDSSAETFATWTLDYYWLSGRLLQDDGRDLELAFSIAERLRARTLLEARDRLRTTADPQHPAAADRRAVLREIAETQRQIMNPTLSDAARQAALDRLTEQEARGQEAERQLALVTRGQPRAGAGFASVSDVQAALGPDEALMSFQLGIWNTVENTFGGGAWLISVTRDRGVVYRIPDRTHFAPLVPVFTGLLAAGDGREMPAAVRLHHDVFSNAIRELPPRVTRLILVPDGPIQQLPFDALRDSAGAQPLAVRFELVVAPSATLWLDSRRHAAREAPGRVLMLADPELEAMIAADSSERQAVLQRGITLGRLPHARRESRAASRHLAGVDALVGSGASEHSVKSRALDEYELVHFAAHAVADELHPERSAVFLAAGDASEDGLLQAREIESLDLEGKVIVLSACQTAAGAVLSGEGVLSLARAFFQAGARAVIGTRWPIRDEDAASLFETFYRELGTGAGLSEALSRAKIQAIADGRPPGVWAGLVLLGDGASRPFPPRRRGAGATAAIAATGLVALALGAVAAARRRRRPPVR
jgi:hypothetical protein